MEGVLNDWNWNGIILGLKSKSLVIFCDVGYLWFWSVIKNICGWLLLLRMLWISIFIISGSLSLDWILIKSLMGNGLVDLVVVVSNW